MKEHWYNEQIYPKNNTDKEGFSYMKYSKRLEQLKPIINELNQICAEEEAICNGALNQLNSIDEISEEEVEELILEDIVGDENNIYDDVSDSDLSDIV